MPGCEDAAVVRTLGHPYEFNPRPWPELLQQSADIEALGHFEPIVRSVIDAARTDLLAGTFWMNDLAVVPTPIPETPLDVLVVSSYGSLHPSFAPGIIRIEHRSVTGRNDVIERPSDEAVALFWRFVIEKFGVSPS